MAFNKRDTLILIIGDFLILGASLWLALFLRNLAVPGFEYFKEHFIPFLPMFLISILIFYTSGLYEKQTRPIRRSMGVRILGSQVATVAISAILFFALPFSIAPKTILVLYLVVSVFAESAWRFYRMRREMHEANRVPAILIGSGPAVHELYDEVRGNGQYLIRFLSQAELTGRTTEQIVEDAKTAVAEGARIIVLDTYGQSTTAILAIREAVPSDILLRDFSALYEEVFDRVSLEHVDTAQLIAIASKQHALYDAAKRLFDIALAIAGSLIAIPFIAVAGLALYLETGTVFFRHERIGKNGRPFLILKLRSMLLNDHGDPELQKKNRVTLLGRIVRKTRIDELPQLWNVLVGDLSFVGPRPELPTIAEVYRKEIPNYELRHLITPGLSGWAQTRDYDAPRGGADVERTKRKLSYDLYYLKHRSFGLDIAIAITTIRALAALSGT